jgi:hypothetical protein
VPAADHFAAVFARAGAEIENAVGGAHDLGIVLDHQDRVSQIAQVVQDLDEPVRVAAVQADGRLVEHVERADQPRSERGGELNALRFAARERRGEPVERQVFQADVVQKAQPSLSSSSSFSAMSACCARAELARKSARLLRRSCCTPGRYSCPRS